jgi:hypothetical protein
VQESDIIFNAAKCHDLSQANDLATLNTAVEVAKLRVGPLSPTKERNLELSALVLQEMQ